ESSDLLLLLRMLSLGQGAWDMIDSQVFKEPRLRLPSEEKSSPVYPTTLPDSFTKYLQENRVACEMGLYFVLHITKQRNKNALQRLLPIL
ncbi:hypothetical protein CRUP_023972, partial [Coryphaenoides rupestris]